MISGWHLVSITDFGPVREISLTALSTGVAADIGHINTNSVVKGYEDPQAGLKECLTGAEIVLIPAGVPRKPGMTRDGVP